MLFTIQSVNLFHIYNFRLWNSKFKHLIDDLAINIWFSWSFVSMKYIRRKCNLIMNFSKFTFNKKNI